MYYYIFIVAGVPGAIYDDDDNDRASGPQIGSKAPRWSSSCKIAPYANHSYQAGKQNHSAGTEKPNFEKGSYFRGSINLHIK